MLENKDELNIFDDFVENDMDLTKISTKYISYIDIFFEDGKKVRLYKEDLPTKVLSVADLPYSIVLDDKEEIISSFFVKVDTALLRHDVNRQLRKLFNKHHIAHDNL